MGENLGRGYKHIGRSGGGDFISAIWLNHVSAPVDKQSRIYMAMMLAGVGFLLPYNSFILAVDFFQTRYPASQIMFDMSMVYIFSAFVAVLLNNIFMERISLNKRITFGYTVSTLTLVFVFAFEIYMETFSPHISYRINLIAISMVAVGCTVQQSSYYGFTSMLPKRYTQAVMTGESAAGVWVSGIRIITKLILDDEMNNTQLFFGINIMIISYCWLSYIAVKKTAFVDFYMTLCQESKRKIVLEPTDDTGLMDLEPNDTPKGQYGVLKLQVSPPPDTGMSLNSNDSLLTNPVEGGQFSAFSFANPVYEPSNNPSNVLNQPTLPISGPSFKVEDVIVRSKNSGRSKGASWAGIKAGMRARWQVAQQIYPYMVFIALAYFVTLCLYPGVLSEITSCRFGNWMPVILMTIFNVGDLIGKMFASRVSEMARSKMAACCSLRLLLMPLILLCCAPRGAPHIAAAGDLAPIVLALLLGVTGGTLGAAPMLAAQQRVRNDAREMAGNIMTLSYNVGLTTGSMVAYLLDEMLGEKVEGFCGFSPTIGPISKLTTRATNVTLAEATTMTTAMILNTVTNSTTLNNLTTAIYAFTTNPTTLASLTTSAAFNNTNISFNITTHTSTISWQLKD